MYLKSSPARRRPVAILIGFYGAINSPKPPVGAVWGPGQLACLGWSPPGSLFKPNRHFIPLSLECHAMPCVQAQ